MEACKVERTIKVKDLPVHDEFKKLLLQQMDELMPVQALSVEAGLLERKNQLIISATATGKTLVGELAGIQNILNNKGKMLFLVPLVALANQKYEQFTRRYSSIATTSLARGNKPHNQRNKRHPHYHSPRTSSLALMKGLISS